MALTKDQILDGISELTVLELKDLLDSFEEISADLYAVVLLAHADSFLLGASLSLG